MSSYGYDARAFQQQPTMQFAAAQQVDLSQLLLFEIKGKPAFAYADIQLQPDQRIVTDGDVMLWMDAGIEEPKTVCWGGCGAAFCRILANEKACMNTFRNKSGELRRVTVGENDPGDMLSFGVTPGNGWVVNDNGFIAGTDNLNVSARFAGCCMCLCSGENMFLTKVTLKDKDAQAGVFLAGGYGAIVRHDVPPGMTLFVSRGLFFAAHEKTNFKIGLAGGARTCCCTWVSWVMKFTGPTVVYTQSRDPKQWNPLKYNPGDRPRDPSSRS